MGTVMKAVIVDESVVNAPASPVRIAFYNQDGTRRKLPGQAEAHQDSEATTIKELVADYNSLLEKLRAAGLMES